MIGTRKLQRLPISLQMFARVGFPSSEDIQGEAIYLASVYRINSDMEVFTDLIELPSPDVQAAAIDAVGIVSQPTYALPMGVDSGWGTFFLDTSPRIDLNPIREFLIQDPTTANRVLTDVFQSEARAGPRTIDELTLGKIRKLMIESPSREVREAAARLLVIRPHKDYQLRVAEWGVWINHGGDLEMVQSVIDEIPDFVHRTGNSIAEIQQGRAKSLMIITKPVIHISVDQPMAVDLSVWINQGRPWFGFPKPNDFEIHSTYRSARPLKLPTAEIPKLEGVKTGYPLFGPFHEKHNMPGALQDVGFRWQSLIATPKKASWMKFNAVHDESHAWWSRLRDVDCSWVSNRGDSERFVYYDGPTSRKSPIDAKLDGGKIKYANPLRSRIDPRPNVLFYIDVEKDRIAGCLHENENAFNPEWKTFEIKEEFQGDEVEARFRRLLLDSALNQDEADGLIDCWRPQFFQTPGKRLLTVFDTKVYDALCSIRVRPEPTELARVGIVLTELESDE